MEGGAGAAVLRGVFGTDTVSFSATSTALANVTRSFTSFTQAANENAMSRIYIGFHFRKSTVDGQALGNAIGAYTATTALAASH